MGQVSFELNNTFKQGPDSIHVLIDRYFVIDYNYINCAVGTKLR